MNLVKIALLIFTIIITILLAVSSFIMYADSMSFEGASSALFFLACTSAFSIFFHVKTATYYPLKRFNKVIVELSKKYWALHIAFGIISLLLGIGMIVLAIEGGKLTLNVLGLTLAFGLLIFGVLTLIETYKLNKFIVSYKKRRERQEEIDEIKGV